jgi:hypothetical protein
MLTENELRINDIPKVQLKAVSKFRIPINRPDQSKFEAILRYKQQQNHAQSLKKAVDAAEVLKLSTAATEPFSEAVKAEKIKEVQEKILSATETFHNLQKEQENLRRSNKLIKNEIASLNDVQSNLLWLLKRSNQYETQRNHSSLG